MKPSGRQPRALGAMGPLARRRRSRRRHRVDPRPRPRCARRGVMARPGRLAGALLTTSQARIWPGRPVLPLAKDRPPAGHAPGRFHRLALRGRRAAVSAFGARKRRSQAGHRDRRRPSPGLQDVRLATIACVNVRFAVFAASISPLLPGNDCPRAMFTGRASVKVRVGGSALLQTPGRSRRRYSAVASSRIRPIGPRWARLGDRTRPDHADSDLYGIRFPVPLANTATAGALRLMAGSPRWIVRPFNSASARTTTS